MEKTEELYYLYNNGNMSLENIVNSDGYTIFDNCDYYSYDNLQDIRYTYGDLNVMHLNILGLSNKIDLSCLLNELNKVGTILILLSYVKVL